MSQFGSISTTKDEDYSNKLWRVISKNNIKSIPNAHSSPLSGKAVDTVFPLLRIFYKEIIYGRKPNWRKL